MNAFSQKTNGLLESENNLVNSIKVFLHDRKSQNLSKGTLYFYEKKTDLFLKFCQKESILNVTDITPDSIRNFILELKESGHNDGGVSAFYRVVKTFMLFWENEIEPENYKDPIRKVKPPRVSTEPIEGVSKDDFYKLVDSCEKKAFFGERDRTILLILLETGIRATELCDLNIDDIDFVDSSMIIRQGKGRKPRNVFIGKTVRKQIRTWLKIRGSEKGSLFISRQGERIAYTTLREIVRRLSKKACIDEPGLHDFRRSFALECLRKGVDIQSIARLMGHNSLQVISRYLHQSKQDLGDSYKSIIDDD